VLTVLPLRVQPAAVHHQCGPFILTAFLSLRGSREGLTWEAGKTREKRVLFISWVDRLLLGRPPGNESFPALKRQGNKFLW
jgi:hypothetical protein